MRSFRKIGCILVVTVVIAVIATVTVRTEIAAASPSGDMIQVVNKVRARNGLSALRPSPSLHRSSRAFSRWLMATDVFGHRSRVSASRRFRRLGEVLAMHKGRRLQIRGTVRSWLASPGHRAVILNSSMPFVGADLTRGRFGRDRRTIWVLQTGRR